MIYVRRIPWQVDETTAAMLDEQSKIACWLYNQLLQRANEYRAIYRETRDRQTGRTVYSKYGLRNLVPGMKRQHPFLRRVYSSVLKNTALRLSHAIANYQDSRHGRRQGRAKNWPKFVSWDRRWFSLQYEEPWVGYALDGRALTLRLGKNEEGKRMTVQGKLVEPLPRRKGESVKQLRIVKEFEQFFAVFTLECETIPLQDQPVVRIIALDPNHRNFAYGVGTDGRSIEIQNLSSLRRLDQRIDILKSRRDRCKRTGKLIEFIRQDKTMHRHWEPSRQWRFFNHKLNRLYRKRRDETKKFLFTLAHQLCREYDVIGIGNYAPQGGGLTKEMRRAMNNQSLIDRFKQITAWVATRSGKTFVEYDERGTTRTCHSCGFVVEGGISPSLRQWQCTQCRMQHLRDENAAQNGLMRVFEKLNLPRSGHTPVVILARWTWQVTPSGVRALRGGVAVQGTI